MHHFDVTRHIWLNCTKVMKSDIADTSRVKFSQYLRKTHEYNARHDEDFIQRDKSEDLDLVTNQFICQLPNWHHSVGTQQLKQKHNRKEKIFSIKGKYNLINIMRLSKY